MGHIRLGTIPKSQPWTSVVESVLGEDSGTQGEQDSLSSEAWISDVAAKTLQAAGKGLEHATSDEGLRYAFYLLTQIALRSRDADWLEGFRRSGIEMKPDGTVFDLAAAFQASVDEHLFLKGHSTDISEIAQRAAGDALCSLAGPRAETLFGNSGDELRLALRTLSTRAGFASLGQQFFGRFLVRYLNFYLSRVTAAGLGKGRMQELGDITKFNAELVRHCEQSAAIVRDFAGEWYSKTEYQKGIDLENAGGFVAVAVRKVQAELRAQGAA